MQVNKCITNKITHKQSKLQSNPQYHASTQSKSLKKTKTSQTVLPRYSSCSAVSFPSGSFPFLFSFCILLEYFIVIVLCFAAPWVGVMDACVMWCVIIYATRYIVGADWRWSKLASYCGGGTDGGSGACQLLGARGEHVCGRDPEEEARIDMEHANCSMC